MGVIEKVAKQICKPNGWRGKALLWWMNCIPRVGVWSLKFLPVKKESIVLDVGCGGGRMVSSLADMIDGGTVYGIDYSKDCVLFARRKNKRLINFGNVEILLGDVSFLPFQDAKFDMVTAVDSYYFWQEVNNGLCEIFRVLKSGGCVALINECYEQEGFEKKNKIWLKYGNFKIHSVDGFKILLQDAGFSEIEIFVHEKKNWIIAIGVKT